MVQVAFYIQYVMRSETDCAYSTARGCQQTKKWPQIFWGPPYTWHPIVATVCQVHYVGMTINGKTHHRIIITIIVQNKTTEISILYVKYSYIPMTRYDINWKRTLENWAVVDCHGRQLPRTYDVEGPTKDGCKMFSTYISQSVAYIFYVS